MESRPFIQTANRACSLLYSYIKEHANGVWILPVNVCPDVPLTFCLADVPFQFVDISSDTLCMDFGMVENLLNDSSTIYAGVLFVRTYGVLENTSEEFAHIKSINKNIVIVDDRCLCLPERNPSFWNSDLILYSTGHCKQIDFGIGGLAYYKTINHYQVDKSLYYDATDEEALYKEALSNGCQLKSIPKGWLLMDNYLSVSDYLSKIETAIIKRAEIRDEINNVYANELPVSIQLSPEYQSWRFNISVPEYLKDKILFELFKKGLFASSHYHSVNRLFDTQSFPISDAFYKGVINLFNDCYYSKEKAKKTCEIINRLLK